MHSRVKSSVTVRHLIRRPLASASLTKSRLQAWLACRAATSGVRSPRFSWHCCAGVPPDPARGRGDTPCCGWCLETRCAACHAHGDNRSAAEALPLHGYGVDALAQPDRASARLRQVALGIAGKPRKTPGPEIEIWECPNIRAMALRSSCGASALPRSDLEGFKIQMGLGQQLLEPGILDPAPSAPGFLGIHAAVLGPPLVERGLAETALPVDLLDRQARFGLLQDRCSAAPYIDSSSCPSFSKLTDLTSIWVVWLRGSRSLRLEFTGEQACLRSSLARRRRGVHSVSGAWTCGGAESGGLRLTDCLRASWLSHLLW